MNSVSGPAAGHARHSRQCEGPAAVRRAHPGIRPHHGAARCRCGTRKTAAGGGRRCGSRRRWSAPRRRARWTSARRRAPRAWRAAAGAPASDGKGRARSATSHVRHGMQRRVRAPALCRQRTSRRRTHTTSAAGAAPRTTRAITSAASSSDLPGRGDGDGDGERSLTRPAGSAPHGMTPAEDQRARGRLAGRLPTGTSGAMHTHLGSRRRPPPARPCARGGPPARGGPAAARRTAPRQRPAGGRAAPAASTAAATSTLPWARCLGTCVRAAGAAATGPERVRRPHLVARHVEGKALKAHAAVQLPRAPPDAARPVACAHAGAAHKPSSARTGHVRGVWSSSAKSPLWGGGHRTQQGRTCREAHAHEGEPPSLLQARRPRHGHLRTRGGPTSRPKPAPGAEVLLAAVSAGRRTSGCRWLAKMPVKPRWHQSMSKAPANALPLPTCQRAQRTSARSLP